jgi:hypothetical protein
MFLKSIATKLTFDSIRFGTLIFLFVFYLERQINIDYYFTIKKIDINILESFFYNYKDLLHGIFLVSLIVAVKIKSNLFSLFTFLMNLYFLRHQHGFLYGADQITNRLLLFFALTSNYKNYPKVAEYGINLFIAMISAMYFHAGSMKLLQEQWWSGEWLHSLVSSNFSNNINLLIKNVMLPASAVIIIVQITAIFLFNKRLKGIYIYILISMHLGIIFILKLPFFGIVCILSLLLILRPPMILKPTKKSSKRGIANEN